MPEKDDLDTCAASGSPLEDLREIIRKYSVPFVGFTVHPWVYSHAQRRLEPDYFGRANFPFPVFVISNQPCPIVKWTSREQMMKFVKRKNAT